MIKSKLFGLLFILTGVCLSSCNQMVDSIIGSINENGSFESSAIERDSEDNSSSEIGVSESNSYKDVSRVYSYIQNDEVASNLSSCVRKTAGGESAQPLNFHSAVSSDYQMLLTECNFDYKNSTGKIAVTLSKESVSLITSRQDGEKWRTFDPLITTLLNGCMIVYDVSRDLKYVRFGKDEKVPCQINDRYVVALLYEGEECLIEELAKGIEGKGKRKDYCFASAVEDDDGYFNETIPEPCSIKRFCLGHNLVDENGYFSSERMNVTYTRIGVLNGNVLTVEDSFFSNSIDKLGTITPLINGNSINYDDFKRVVPDYFSYYQSDAFRGKKDIPFTEHVYEFLEEKNYLGHVVYFYEDYDHLQNCVKKNPFISEFVSKYNESFFAENDIIIVSDFHSSTKYYELHFEGIFLQSGIISMSLRKDYIEGRRGSTFTVAELSKSDVATLESDYISYPADALAS